MRLGMHSSMLCHVARVNVNTLPFWLDLHDYGSTVFTTGTVGDGVVFMYSHSHNGALINLAYDVPSLLVKQHV